MRVNYWNKMVSTILVLCLAFGLLATTQSTLAVNTYSIESGVKTASDDMEEWITNKTPELVGMLDYNSSDLELGLEKPGSTPDQEQYVGIRFADLSIPSGATITSAYIQFTVDEVKSPANPFDVNIYAEDSANAAQYNRGSATACLVANDLSSRKVTALSVNWAPDDDASTLWTINDEAGELQRTPDLSTLVQTIVDKDGWSYGNAISFIMTGTGNRTAYSYDRDPTKAAVLHVTYSYNGTLEQEAPTGLSSVAPTTLGGFNGKITGTTVEMEYKLSTDPVSAYTACSGTEITGLSAGTYSVRFAEKSGYNASSATEVTVASQSAPTGFTGFPVSVAGETDGRITGTTAEMEYKKSYDTDWTTCTGIELIGLAAGIYQIRFIAQDGQGASDAAEVVVSAVTKIAVTFIESEENDVTNSRGFTWYTVAASDTRSDLQVVEKTGASADFIGSAALTFTGTAAAVDTTDTTESQAQEFMHKAEATGLDPDTTYFFRVGDADLNMWSETGTFTTSSGDGAFTFLDLADPQAKKLDEALLAVNTFEAAVETVPDASFIVVNGDLVDTGSNENEWDWLFNNMSDVMLNFTIAPIAGNHEKEPDSFFNHFNLIPAEDSETSTGVYYSFDYSNAHFVMMNTNEYSFEYSDLSEDQVEWMQADIGTAKEEGKWIIVVLHKGPYTTSNHATDSGIMGATGVRTLIAPMFAELGVDLVLQGHDHIYARTKAIDENGNTDSPEIITEIVDGETVEYQVNPDGSIYLIPSTAGPKVYYQNQEESLGGDYYDLFDVADESHADVYGPDPSDPSRPVRSMVENFSSITIDGDKMTVISYEIDNGGLISDTTDPYIIDTFGIIKETFNDVNYGSWYKEAVEYIASEGITNGIGDGNFGPEMNITRGQFLVMMMRAYGIDPVENPTDNFTDAGDSYYTGYLAAAKELGISEGIGDNLFAPESAISRQDAFTLLYRALEVLGALPANSTGKTISDFSDSSKVADYASAAINSLIGSGIVQGSGDMLKPTSNCTRAEMAQILFNLLAA